MSSWVFERRFTGSREEVGLERRLGGREGRLVMREW